MSYDRSKIMKAAWAYYRERRAYEGRVASGRSPFGKPVGFEQTPHGKLIGDCIRRAWDDARARVADAEWLAQHNAQSSAAQERTRLWNKSRWNAADRAWYAELERAA